MSLQWPPTYLFLLSYFGVIGSQKNSFKPKPLVSHLTPKFVVLLDSLCPFVCFLWTMRQALQSYNIFFNTTYLCINISWKGYLCGCSTECLLLEVSRVVVHTQNERSFHIMYMIYAAMKEKYRMERCEECIFQVYVNSYQTFLLKKTCLYHIHSIHIVHVWLFDIWSVLKPFRTGVKKCPLFDIIIE